MANATVNSGQLHSGFRRVMLTDNKPWPIAEDASELEVEIDLEAVAPQREPLAVGSWARTRQGRHAK